MEALLNEVTAAVTLSWIYFIYSVVRRIVIGRASACHAYESMCIYDTHCGRVDREMSGLEAQNLCWCLPGCDAAAMDCFSYSSDTNDWVKS